MPPHRRGVERASGRGTGAGAPYLCPPLMCVDTVLGTLSRREGGGRRLEARGRRRRHRGDRVLCQGLWGEAGEEAEVGVELRLLVYLVD